MNSSLLVALRRDDLTQLPEGSEGRSVGLLGDFQGTHSDYLNFKSGSVTLSSGMLPQGYFSPHLSDDFNVTHLWP